MLLLWKRVVPIDKYTQFVTYKLKRRFLKYYSFQLNSILTSKVVVSNIRDVIKGKSFVVAEVHRQTGAPLTVRVSLRERLIRSAKHHVHQLPEKQTTFKVSLLFYTCLLLCIYSPTNRTSVFCFSSSSSLLLNFMVFMLKTRSPPPPSVHVPYLFRVSF